MHHSAKSYLLRSAVVFLSLYQVQTEFILLVFYFRCDMDTDLQLHLLCSWWVIIRIGSRYRYYTLRWTKACSEWYPRDVKRNRGHPDGTITWITWGRQLNHFVFCIHEAFFATELWKGRRLRRGLCTRWGFNRLMMLVYLGRVKVWQI